MIASAGRRGKQLDAFAREKHYGRVLPDASDNDSQQPPVPPESPVLAKRAGARATAWIILSLLAVAGIFRLLFGADMLKGAGGLVSLSFLFWVPFAVGAASVAIERWRGGNRWFLPAVVVPTVVLSLGTLLCLFTKLEAMICVVMALPILYASAILGGLIAHSLLPRNDRGARLYLSLALLLPFAAAGLESTLRWPAETRAIEDTIVIRAPASLIWPEIASVRAIDSRSIPDKWIYRIGFPKPIAATLDHAGVGGVRTATFERGVSFFETVTEWAPPRRLAFTIHADPEFIPHTAFDRHIIVGGRFYDVLDGVYEIEPLDASSCRLHLTSHHRLGTRFNAYAGWWSERIMNQIQGSILEVIRRRAEQSAGTSLPARGGSPVRVDAGQGAGA